MQSKTELMKNEYLKIEAIVAGTRIEGELEDHNPGGPEEKVKIGAWTVSVRDIAAWRVTE